MKKKFLAGVVAGVFMLGMVGMAQAIPMATVGGYDQLIASGIQGSADLPSSGDDDELAWMNKMLLDGNYITEAYDFLVFKDNTEDGAGWEAVDAVSGAYAYNMPEEPDFFMVKTGNVQTSLYTHFLYQNKEGFDWAVINLGDLGIVSVTNISKLSHIDGVGGSPVPEPATLMLFGSGLVGLGWFWRRKKV